MSAPEHLPTGLNLGQMLFTELVTRPDTQAGTDDVSRYRVGKELGRGGFGVVFHAQQTAPLQRDVAIKFLRPEAITFALRGRFRQEQRTLSLMDHPNVAQVLDAGTDDAGRSFFVMELVNGVPLHEYCETHELSVREKLQIFSDICRGIQHAHQKGIVHQDIKPDNILVSTVDGRPVPRVIDFGIAKVANAADIRKTRYTQVGELVGSPAYMSPEQANSTSVDVDTRSDQYSLGVLLYELLTGSPPFNIQELMEDGYSEMLKCICETQPERPSSRITSIQRRSKAIFVNDQTAPRHHSSLIRGDLDWIVMKCLEKDRERRYETVGALIEDIQRHLNNEPVRAAVPSMAYQFRKFVRRNRTAVIAAAFVAFALTTGVIAAGTSLVQALEAERATDRQLMLAVAAEEAVRQELKQAVIAEAEASSRLDLANEVKKLTLSMLGHIHPVNDGGEDTQLLQQILDETAARLDAGEIADELIELEMRQFLADSYLSVGNPSAAEHHLTAIHSHLEQRDVGQTDEITNWCNLRMGNARGALGKWEEADNLLRQTLAKRKARFGEGDSRTREAIQALGELFYNKNELQKGYEYLVFASTPELLPDSDGYENWLNVQTRLTQVLLKQSKLLDARKLCESTLAAKREYYSADHPSVLQSMAILASVCESEGDLDATEAWLASAFEGRQRALGKDHPATRRTQKKLAGVYVRTRQFGKAEPMLQAKLEYQRRTLSQPHASTVMILDQLAQTQTHLGQFKEALESLTASFESRKVLLGEKHAETLQSRLRIGMFLRDRNKAAEAAKILIAVAEVQRETLGLDHEVTLSTYQALGELYRDLKQNEEAEDVLARTLEIRQCVLGCDHVDTLNTLLTLCEVLDKTDQPENSEALVLDAYNKSHSLHAAEHPQSLKASKLLAGWCVKDGQFDRATSLLAAAIAIEEKLFGIEHVDTTATKQQMAKVYSAAGSYDKADELVTSVYELQVKILGQSDPMTVASRELMTANLNLLLAERHTNLGYEAALTRATLDRLIQIYESSSQYSQVERVWSEVWQRNVRLRGEDHPTSLVSQIGLLHSRSFTSNDVSPVISRDGTTHARTCSLTEADIRVCERLRKLDRQNPLGDGLPVYSIGAILARGYEKFGRQADAEAAYLEAMSVAEKRYGKNHAATRLLMNSLAVKYTFWRMPLKAIKLAQQLCDINESLGAPSWVHLDTLAEAHFVAGNIATAIEIQKKALALPGGHPLLHEHLRQYSDALAAETKARPSSD